MTEICNAYFKTHSEFRIRYWIIETAIALVLRNEITPGDGIAAVQQAIKLGFDLCAPRSESVRRRIIAGRERLRALLPSHVHEVVIVYDPIEPKVSCDDEFDWMRRFTQPGGSPILGAKWELIDPSTEAVDLTRENLQDPRQSNIELTIGQQECIAELESYWWALMGGGIAGGYRMRNPLIVAPSGAGKTRLVQTLSEKLNVPLFAVDIGSWMLNGSKSEKPTLAILEAWHGASEEGIVLIDELDKASGRDGGWWQGVNLELMSYLDGRVQWPASLVNKLRRRFLMIGAGTWQAVFRHADRNIGFSDKSGNVASQMIEWEYGTADSVPEELAFRFDQPILLGGITRAEFSDRVATIRAELRLPALSLETLALLSNEAVASRRGQRWLEFYAGRMMRDCANFGRQSEVIWNNNAFRE